MSFYDFFLAVAAECNERLFLSGLLGCFFKV